MEKTHFESAEDIFDNANKYSHVDLKGLHVHIGSQITDPKPFVTSLNKVLEFIESSNINIEWLNIGGGFGIIYDEEEKSTTAQEFAKRYFRSLRASRSRLYWSREGLLWVIAACLCAR